ncbi:hypothetical protein [Rhizobium leguminosarum]|uniref:hypothetical protein n=1 Tax=Rhizobium leguminosarum TaxID=384 RepID=UPI001649EF89
MALPRCGVTMTVSIRPSASGTSGSASQTPSPAPRIMLFFAVSNPFTEASCRAP